MKEIKINLPASIKECGADTMYKWMLVSDTISTINEKSITEILEFHCQLVSIFSGMAINKVKRAVPDSIMEASKHIFNILSQYEKQEPQEVIEIEGKKFRLEKNFGHVTTGQIIDLKLIEDISADPWAPLAIMYVEDDMEYCQEDDRGRVLNPNDVRHKLFKEHFPGDEFLNFYAFFLKQLRRAESRYFGNPDSEDDDAEDDNGARVADSEWFIWTGIIHRLSKEMGCSVDRIAKQPYVKSLFWMNYFKLSDEQKRIINKQHG
jgi:hypothetical protein